MRKKVLPLSPCRWPRLQISGRTAWMCLAIAVLALSGAANGEKIKGDRLLAPDRLLEVQIEIPANDWQRLRAKSRSFGADYNDKPYAYVKGDISIDGLKIKSVGIRKKGFFGSTDSERPSLKIKFDEYVKQKPIKGLSRLTLNNNKQDSSLASQMITYRLFNAAGLHAPRCNLARVTVNGEYLGVYTNVESIKKPFLKRRFGDSSGNLFEGTIADFYPKAIGKIEAKANDPNVDRTKIKRLAELLEADGTLDLDKLDELIDTDYFLRFWALESLIAFWDGYGNNQNNYYVYEAPKDGKLYFIPWGADSCFSSFQGPFGRFGQGAGTTAVYAKAMLANRLYHVKGMPERYRRTMLKLLEEVWDEEKLLAEVDRIEKLVANQLHDRQSGAARASENMREFIRGRRQEMLEEFKSWPAEVQAAPRKPSYTVQVGSARGSFAAVWRDTPTENPVEAGSAKIQLELDGKPVVIEKLEVAAQPGRVFRFGRGGIGGSQAAPLATVVLTGTRPGEAGFTLTLSIDREAFASASGKTVAVQGSLTEGRGGGFGGFGFGGQGRRTVSGQVKFSQASIKPGEPVTGELTVKILETRGGFLGGNRGGGNRGGFGGGFAPPPRRTPDPDAAQRSKRLKTAVATFRKIDANRDGKLQKKEWEKSDKSLKGADANSDTTISLKELIDWLKMSEPKEQPEKRATAPESKN